MMMKRLAERVYLSPPHMGSVERQLLLEAFDSNWIAPLGPHVDAFEREMAAQVGVPHAVALSSGTAGLHMGLKLMGVGPGDEVVLSGMTFAATAFAVTYLGATPVFMDSSADTWNMDPELLTMELKRCADRNKLPKAVLVVDLYGQCADYDPILKACEEYNIPVIEDAAEALGATYKGKKAGSLGRLGVFSFNGNKIITTSGGGMLVSARAELIDKARFWATQARDAAPHYEHSEIGYNYRLSNLLAAVGRGQLQHLEERLAARRATNQAYRRALANVPGLGFMPEAPYGQSNCWLTCITVEPRLFGATREDIRLELEKLNIEARPVWKPMHMQPIFTTCRTCGGAVSQKLFENGLCLPSGSSLSACARECIIETILRVHKTR